MTSEITAGIYAEVELWSQSDAKHSDGVSR